MIAIVNVEGTDNGVCKYEVRINRDVITSFEHNRSDELEICLRKAADSVKLHRAKQLQDSMLDILRMQQIITDKSMTK